MTSDSDVMLSVLKHWPALSNAMFGCVLPLDENPRATAIKHQIVVGGTAGLWRIEGRAGHATQTKTFSIVAKQLLSTASGSERWRVSEEVTHPFYWRREGLAYRDGLFGEANAAVRPATCYLVEESTPGITLYLEDVKGRQGPSWTLRDYVYAAQCLGEYQGENKIDNEPVGGAQLETNAFLIEYLRRRTSLVESVGEIMQPRTDYLEDEGLRDLESEHGNLHEFFLERSAGLRFIGQFVQSCAGWSRP